MKPYPQDYPSYCCKKCPPVTHNTYTATKTRVKTHKISTPSNPLTYNQKTRYPHTTSLIRHKATWPSGLRRRLQETGNWRSEMAWVRIPLLSTGFTFAVEVLLCIPRLHFIEIFCRVDLLTNPYFVHIRPSFQVVTATKAMIGGRSDRPTTTVQATRRQK